MKVLSLCDGIGSGLEALKRAGVTVTQYDAIEISEIKRKIANENHLEISRPAHDVREFEPGLYDLILCGFSCKSLSSQGSRTGFDGESKIFYKCLEIVNKAQKLNPDLKVFFENVASMTNECRDEISNKLFIPYCKINAGDFSAQDRNRYYWFNWEENMQEKEISPSELLDNDGLLLFSVSKSNRNKIGEAAIVEGRIKASGKAGTLTTGKNCWGQSTRNYVITKNLHIRPPSLNECARLQGLDNYKWPCSDNQAFEAIGDGWQIDTVMEIFKALL